MIKARPKQAGGTMKLSTFGIVAGGFLLLAACGKTTAPGGTTVPNSTQGGNGAAPAQHTMIGSCDTGASPFGAGDGSAATPFQICSVAQLTAISCQANTAADYMLV